MSLRSLKALPFAATLVGLAAVPGWSAGFEEPQAIRAAVQAVAAAQIAAAQGANVQIEVGEIELAHPSCRMRFAPGHAATERGAGHDRAG